MRILITGADGFVGSHLRDALGRGLGHDIFCPNEFAMDLRKASDVTAFVKQVQPEVVIHLAAKTEVAFSFDDYEDFGRVNYLGTVLLAEACRQHCPDFKQFIMASTMEVYGHQAKHAAFTELTTPNPCAPYAVAKLASENYLHYMRYAYNFPSTVLRQTNSYGRTNTTFFVMERIISQMMDGDTVLLGEPDPIRNFLFIDDLIGLYRRVLGNEKAIGETFVTGPDNGLCIRELVDQCAETLDWNGDVTWQTIPKRPGEIFYLNSDPTKAMNILGWAPRISLTQGIAMTAERIRASGDAFVEKVEKLLTLKAELPEITIATDAEMPEVLRRILLERRLRLAK